MSYKMEHTMVTLDNTTALRIVHFLEALYDIHFIEDFSFNYEDSNTPADQPAPVNFYIKAWNIPQ